MTKEELRQLSDERERLRRLAETYGMANTSGLTADQRFELDIEYRSALQDLRSIDGKYAKALGDYMTDKAKKAIAECLE